MKNGKEPRSCIWKKNAGVSFNFVDPTLTGKLAGSEFSVAGRYALLVRHTSRRGR
jgi:hypothetical protein